MKLGITKKRQQQFQILKILIAKELRVCVRSPKTLILQILLPIAVISIMCVARKLFTIDVYDDNIFYIRIPVDEKPSNLDFQSSNYSWAIYTPSDSVTTRLVSLIEQKTGIKFKAFPNENTAVHTLNRSLIFKFVLVFNVTEFNNVSTYSYKLRFHTLILESSKRNFSHKKSRLPWLRAKSKFLSNLSLNVINWHTNDIQPDPSYERSRNIYKNGGGSPEYYANGLLWIQNAIDESIIEYTATVKNKLIPNIVKYVRRMPVASFVNDIYPQIAGYQFVFAVTVAYSFAVLSIAKIIMTDKEKGIEAILQIMGIKHWQIWISYFTRILMIYTITCLLITIIIFIPIPTNTVRASVLRLSHPIIIYAFWMQYTITTIGFVFMLTRFFQKASFAATFSTLIFLVSSAPWFIISANYHTIPLAIKYVACLVSNVAFSFCMNFVWHWESQEIGLTWNTLAQTIHRADPFTFIHAYFMLILDFIIYVLIGTFVEQVHPGDFGIAKPWNFLLKKFTFRQQADIKRQSLSAEDIVHFKDPRLLISDERNDLPCFESVNLSKIFKGGFRQKDIIALDRVNVGFYSGEITALLGQNGAGKSTLINILIGMINATDGQLFWHEEESKTRPSIGFCPQHNTVIDKLTVMEHLKFFANLKGNKFIDELECTKILKQLDLQQWSNTLANNLSGGKKRALSLAIALSNNPKLIILDEPTSGMDPVNRKRVWDLLRMIKSNQCIIITTHYMQEAHAMSDRIVIISKGYVVCVGSGEFLQDELCNGYEITIVAKDESYTDQIISDITKNSKHNIRVTNHLGKEIKIFVDDCEEERISELLERLETSRFIEGFGISMITLDEIFNRISTITDADKSTIKDLKTSQIHSVATAEHAHISAQMLSTNTKPYALDDRGRLKLVLHKFHCWMTILLSCMHKNALYAWRTWFMIGLELFPALIIAFVLLFIVSIDLFKSPQVLNIKQSMFSYAKIPVHYMPLTVSPGSDNACNFAPTFNDTEMPTQTCLIYKQLINQLQIPNHNVVSSNTVNITYDNCQSDNIQNLLICIASTHAKVYNQEMPFAFLLSDSPVNNRSSTNNNFKTRQVDQASSGNQTKNKINDSISYITMEFNGQPYHSSPIVLNILSNTILKLLDNNTLIETSYDPLPAPNFYIKFDHIQQTSAFSQFWGMFFTIGFSICLAGFAVSKVNERSCGFKYLQHLAGVNSRTYWLAAFICDYISYIFALTVCMIITAGFTLTSDNLLSLQPLMKPPLLGYLILAELGYGAACILFVYVLSFMFSKEVKAYIWIAQLNIAFGQVLTVVVNILAGNDFDKEILDQIQEIFIILSPGFSMSMAASYISSQSMFKNLCEQQGLKLICALNLTHPCCKHTCKDNCIDQEATSITHMHIPGIGGILLSNAFHIMIYVIIITLIEKDIFSVVICSIKRRLTFLTKPIKRNNKLSSMNMEQLNIDTNSLASTSDQQRAAIVQTVDIHKYYGSKCALQGINLKLRSNECYGIIGPNGAGKTTLLSILIGSLKQTSGLVITNRSGQSRGTYKYIGYCPQGDALVPYLTGYETLRLFAKIRGFKSHKYLVRNVIQAVDIKNHSHKRVDAFSGGNKRKLNLAIAAIIGNDFLILDEPTCGVDPTSRRILWVFIEALKKAGKCVLLTSHSMDECEVLCSRVSVLINSSIEITGTVQELKMTYGKFYWLYVKLKNYSTEEDEEQHMLLQHAVEGECCHQQEKTEQSSDGIEPGTVSVLENFIHENFPKSEVLLRKSCYTTFRINRENISLNSLFKALNSNQAALSIENFFVSQENLEQLFDRMVLTSSKTQSP